MKYHPLIFFFLFLLGTSVPGITQEQVTNLVCEYKANPIGIDIEKPRLSWQIQSTGENVKQTAYEIRVAASEDHLTKEKKLLWITDKVASDQSVNVIYGGPSLSSMQRTYWQVRIWTNENKVTDWSEVAFWEVGLLNNEDWLAAWITKKNEQQGKESLPAQYYRKDFTTSKKIMRARVYVTSLGLYQLYFLSLTRFRVKRGYSPM